MIFFLDQSLNCVFQPDDGGNISLGGYRFVQYRIRHLFNDEDRTTINASFWVELILHTSFESFKKSTMDIRLLWLKKYDFIFDMTFFLSLSYSQTLFCRSGDISKTIRPVVDGWIFIWRFLLCSHWHCRKYQRFLNDYSTSMTRVI